MLVCFYFLFSHTKVLDLNIQADGDMIIFLHLCWLGSELYGLRTVVFSHKKFKDILLDLDRERQTSSIVFNISLQNIADHYL